MKNMSAVDITYPRFLFHTVRLRNKTLLVEKAALAALLTYLIRKDKFSSMYLSFQEISIV